MAQGYYSIEEAAQVLGVSEDELKRMARRNEIRPFHDRGTMRFRTQEIDEVARALGRSSDSELRLGDAPLPTPHDSPAPKAGKPEPADEPFDFTLAAEDEQVELGRDPGADAPGSSRRSGPRSPGPKSPSSKAGGSPSKAGFVPPDSDVVLPLVDTGEPAGPPSSATRRKAGMPTAPKSGPKPKSDAPKRKTGFGSDPRGDSGVRLVPMEGDIDSDVRIVSDNPDDVLIGDLPRSAEDSDIRLDEKRPRPKSGLHPKPGSSDESMQTEEIDLDAELRKAQESAPPPSRKSKLKAPAVPQMPTTSPFELSAEDLPRPKPPDSGAKVGGGKGQPPARKEEAADEEVELGELAPGSSLIGASSDSGVNLQSPSDSGISLEKATESSDEVDFELKLEDGVSSTPTKGEVIPEEDASEFELTLDDSGLAPLEGQEGAAAAEGEKDIFETDFEMPALEDESSTEGAEPLEESDTDLESSDFDLALGDSDIGADEESGSQVVALEDEEADEAAKTVARPGRPRVADLEEEGIEDLLADEGAADEQVEPEAETEEEEARPRVAAAAAPAPWGVFPALFLLPCVVVLFVVGVMGYELLQGMGGYKQPSRPTGGLISSVSDWLGVEYSKE
jgi:excisionase family DNA binding protein